MLNSETAEKQPATERRRAEDLTQEEVVLFQERGMFPGVVGDYPKSMSLPAIIADVRSRAERAATTCPTCGGRKPDEKIQKSQSIAEIPAPTRHNGRREGPSWGNIPGVVNPAQVY